MSVIYSQYRDAYIDLDKEPEYEPCDMIYDFVNELDFNENLYDNCNFGTEWDDFQKWIVIEDYPKVDLFYDDLLEYAKDRLGRELEQDEKDELIAEFDKEWYTILDDCEEWLIDRYRDRLDDDGGDY